MLIFNAGTETWCDDRGSYSVALYRTEVISCGASSRGAITEVTYDADIARDYAGTLTLTKTYDNGDYDGFPATLELSA